MSLSISLATTATAVVVALLLVTLADERVEPAVSASVAPQVAAQATLLAQILPQDASPSELEVQRRSIGAEALALFDPSGTPIVVAGAWLTPVGPEAIRGALGTAGVGPISEFEDGRDVVYQTAFAPLPTSPGWTVGLETAVGMEAIERLELLQSLAGVFTVLLAGALGLGLGMVVSNPLRRLEREVSAVRPGDPPEAVGVGGPRENRAIGMAVRELLQAVRERDRAVADAHEQEVAHLVRLAAEVAHEIRNPLHTLTLSVGRLVTVQDPEKRTRIAERVHQQLGHLEVIVQRLLDLTRPITVTARPVDLVELLDLVTADCAASIERHHAPALPLQTDPVLVGQILRNLLTNAEQAGAARIVITAGITANRVTVQVQDDGSGIDDDQRKALFVWFQTTRAQGSGLGLPTSRRLATALGGTLSCMKARPATFVLELPFEAR